MLSCSLAISACGFQPLYEPSTLSSPQTLPPIKIATIQGRSGQILRNYLIDLLKPQTTTSRTKYLLNIKLTGSTKSIGVRKDETTGRQEAIVTALITLQDIEKKKTVYTHSLNSINSFNIQTGQYYRTQVAEDYALKQALRQLAEKITLHICTYYRSQSK